ncbi:flagellar hook-basal body complex protein [Porcipelethomonas sp.]|uniref:flagellar hook-basal body complex protein n=1 Tax=Porcipelethomonas sp. TaxID=2981675 RepID=UPI003EF6D5A7
MVRSLYSGVAGMTTHQKKMDVIGNNISNVSTYGYKSSRATFRDVYYQTSNSASAPTPTSGGVNPTQIGYGAKLGSVDVNHSQSVMSTTGYTLDVAIAGEGYLQVMDGDGNIFYTRAGMLDIDSEGNVIDVNGNFVLGVSGSPTGRPASSDKIKITLPYENAAAASASDTINDVTYTISAANETDSGNVNIVFAASSNLPIGQKAEAKITSSSIVVTLNSNETFSSLAQLNQEMNNAITAANGGVQHPGGAYTITMSDPAAFSGVLTGAEIVNADFGVNSGTVTLPNDIAQYFSVKSVGDEFSGNGNATMSFTLTQGNNFTITLGQYAATLNAEQLKNAGTVVLKRSGIDSNDSITISYPNLNTINAYNIQDMTGVATLTPSEPSSNLGLGQGSFILSGGTEGGEQTVADLSGISINDKGIISGTHPTFGLMELGRIDLATFSNPAGLSQVGDTYFSESQNSGEPQVVIAGSEGSGDILGGTLETSNTDLSNEFADMITTQRGFQACSRLITVSDTMLEELINLKR